MPRHPLILALLGVACGSDPRAVTTTSVADATGSAPPAASATATPHPTSSGARTSAPDDRCATLSPIPCTRTPGCILDQAGYDALFCRAAEDRCESAVRHADLIGGDADAAVTDETMRDARARCNATAGCFATSGECSCPCAILGNCDCECGGHYLARCAMESEKTILQGTPPTDLSKSPIAPWGAALVAVARARRDQPYRVHPLPDPAPLVGMSQHDIASVLGTARPCTGKALPSAPCESGDQAFYSLYRLPIDSVGGGPELLLTFDAKKVCTSAAVRHTR